MTYGSGAVQVGMDTWFVQVLVISQGVSCGPGRSRSWLVELTVM